MVTQSAPFMAFLTRDKSEFVMIKGEWRMKSPAGDLMKWLTFYRGLRDRGGPKSGGPGPWAKFFMEPVEVLETLAKQVTQ